jgi:hypothetical protein
LPNLEGEDDGGMRAGRRRKARGQSPR